MTDTNDSRFVGSIPDYYDRGLGPVIFADYAADMARRLGGLAPARVLKFRPADAMCSMPPMRIH